MYTDVYDKQALVAHYEALLQQGLYKGLQVKELLTKARTDKNIIIQKSSGTQGKPLVIPRTLSDLSNTFLRIFKPHYDYYQSYPKRVAMIGGVSHTEAALKVALSHTDLQSFGLNELAELTQYSPDMIFCYPSVMREVLAQKIKLPQLQTVKLGGEAVFNADVKNIFKHYSNCLLIEQFGSTEMPAIALRTYTLQRQHNAYQLQTDRFEFLNFIGEGWKPIIVKDKFTELILPMNAFYDTGDEGLLSNNQLIAVRRKNDPAYAYYFIVEKFLDADCENIQIDLQNNIIKYKGGVDIPRKINFLEKEFSTKKTELKRIKESNKLPLVLFN